MAVSKRGESWAVTVYNPVTKQKRWVGTYLNQREARKAEASALLSRRRSGITVEAYAGSWLKLHARPRKATNLHYAEMIGLFVRTHGQRQLESFTRPEAVEWAFSHRSLASVVRTMFSDAQRDGVVSENVFMGLRLQQSRGRRDLDVLSEAEVDQLGQVANDTYGPGFAAFVLTAAHCGLRPGELYALRWPRVDFRNDELEIVGSYSTRSRETTAPKNNQHRRIVLFPKAKEALLRVPARGDVVFRTLTNRPLDGRSVHYYWHPVRTAIGRPTMTFYELRHFCAAHLLNTLGHEAEDVAFQLGHTDGGVLIRRLYGHPSEQLARERLKRALGRKITPIRLVSGADAEQNAV